MMDDYKPKHDTGVKPEASRNTIEPSDGKINRFVQEITTWGTPACGLLCACIGLAIAVLLLTCGLWHTLFIAALTAIGAILGGVGHKADVLKRLINKLFPPKDQTM